MPRRKIMKFRRNSVILAEIRADRLNKIHLLLVTST
tara:strand:- start:989 stop:1096 length:108 start_codon:yes stop_codon:yes gene_type:complete